SSVLGEPLMSYTHSHVVRESLGHQQIPARVFVRSPRKQAEHADPLTVDAYRYTQAGPQTAFRSWRGIQQLGHVGVGDWTRPSLAQYFWRAIARSRVEAELRSVTDPQRQVRLVMRHNARCRRAELFEDVADVEPTSERGQQFVKGAEPVEIVANRFGVDSQRQDGGRDLGDLCEHGVGPPLSVRRSSRTELDIYSSSNTCLNESPFRVGSRHRPSASDNSLERPPWVV